VRPDARRARARAALVRALAPLAELGPEYLAASEGAIYLWAKLPPGAPEGWGQVILGYSCRPVRQGVDAAAGRSSRLAPSFRPGGTEPVARLTRASGSVSCRERAPVERCTSGT